MNFGFGLSFLSEEEFLGKTSCFFSMEVFSAFCWSSLSETLLVVVEEVDDEEDLLEIFLVASKMRLATL